MRRVFLITAVLSAVAVVGIYFALTAVLDFEKGGIGQGGDVVINMTTRSWRFDPQIISGKEIASASSSPSTGAFVDTLIKVKQGSKVIIWITNLEPNQPHGFTLEEFGIQSVVIPPHQTVDVKFMADKEGSFTFFCTVFCGTGHPRHKGTLVVER